MPQEGYNDWLRVPTEIRTIDFPFQAVQQFGGTTTNMFEISDSDSDNRNGGFIFGTPGVWARIHTIYYRPGLKNFYVEKSFRGSRDYNPRLPLLIGTT